VTKTLVYERQKIQAFMSFLLQIMLQKRHLQSPTMDMFIIWSKTYLQKYLIAESTQQR